MARRAHHTPLVYDGSNPEHRAAAREANGLPPEASNADPAGQLVPSDQDHAPRIGDTVRYATRGVSHMRIGTVVAISRGELVIENAATGQHHRREPGRVAVYGRPMHIPTLEPVPVMAPQLTLI